MVFEEKTVSSKKIFDGKIIKVKIDTVSLPDGKTASRELVEHPGGVGIVALTDDGKIIMVRQYRKPLDCAIYEIPAGKLDKNEDVEACGRRELLEETGATAENFIYLGFIYPSPGFTDEVTHMYLATGLHFGEKNLDDDEFLDVEFFARDEVLRMIMNNEINDAKTVAGFFKAEKMLKRGE